MKKLLKDILKSRFFLIEGIFILLGVLISLISKLLGGTYLKISECLIISLIMATPFISYNLHKRMDDPENKISYCKEKMTITIQRKNLIPQRLIIFAGDSEKTLKFEGNPFIQMDLTTKEKTLNILSTMGKSSMFSVKELERDIENIELLKQVSKKGEVLKVYSASMNSYQLEGEIYTKLELNQLNKILKILKEKVLNYRMKNIKDGFSSADLLSKYSIQVTDEEKKKIEEILSLSVKKKEDNNGKE